MAHIGDEHIGIITLEECTPGTANRKERQWIKKLSPTLNVCNVPIYSWCWELLFRANLVPKVLARERLCDAIHTLTTTLRCIAPPCDQLAQVQQVTKYRSQWEAHATFQKVRHRIARQTFVHIPYRTPTLRAVNGKPLRDHVTKMSAPCPHPQTCGDTIAPLYPPSTSKDGPCEARCAGRSSLVRF